ncbi:MAG: hypothetical protein DWQ29_13780 [Planctomycetota bacterium]|nr:MAG: hypothetical protein DWQ29_13780 [Planctomycetota bacterium]
MLFGIALNGICHVFLVIVIQIFLDAECPAELRNSVQNVFAFLTLGVAMPVGLMLSQPLIARFTTTGADGAGVVDFSAVFLAASFVLAALMLAFWWWFKPVESETSTSRSARD